MVCEEDVELKCEKFRLFANIPEAKFWVNEKIFFECKFAGERCSKENKLDEKHYNEDMYIVHARQETRR
jgi:hypothetical protein